MQIRYKGSIQHGIISDAPFIGARLSSIDCDRGCFGCFNQDLRRAEIKEADSKWIIGEIKSNPLNEGIILGGLEWSLQIEELHALITDAQDAGLKVMLYSGKSWSALRIKLDYILKNLKTPIFIKCGAYMRSLPSKYLDQYDVLLASSNQEIIYYDPNDKGIKYHDKDQ